VVETTNMSKKTRGTLELINIVEWEPKLEEVERNIYWALNPKVELKISPIQGGGLFAKEKIYAGEVIWNDVRCASSLCSLLPAKPSGGVSMRMREYRAPHLFERWIFLEFLYWPKVFREHYLT